MTEEQFHWEDEDGMWTIYCDVKGCDWTGTAYASQFALHHHRDHEPS